jgi:hypothetical protein
MHVLTRKLSFSIVTALNTLLMLMGISPIFIFSKSVEGENKKVMAVVTWVKTEVDPAELRLNLNCVTPHYTLTYSMDALTNAHVLVLSWLYQKEVPDTSCDAAIAQALQLEQDAKDARVVAGKRGVVGRNSNYSQDAELALHLHMQLNGRGSAGIGPADALTDAQLTAWLALGCVARKPVTDAGRLEELRRSPL